MSSRSKREYLEEIYQRYKRTSRKDKAIERDPWDLAGLHLAFFISEIRVGYKGAKLGVFRCIQNFNDVPAL